MTPIIRVSLSTWMPTNKFLAGSSMAHKHVNTTLINKIIIFL